MMTGMFKKIFGSRNERLVKNYSKIVARINMLEPEISALSDEQLQAKTTEFRQRLQDGATVHDLLPEAFAVVREAGKRVFNMRHFDVQLIGGMVLNDGKIAEMRTGEGKTLVATLAAYLNALPGQGVHVVTVNDYLAKRDSVWMGQVYEFLGLTVGCIQNTMDSFQRRREYACDIIYGTNNEFGFDYLRDNMVVNPDDLVQREHYYAIVDEVDSVLIDEARTPLIISGPVKSEEHKFNEMKPHVDRLVGAQRQFITKIVAEAEKHLAEGRQEEAGVQLLRASRGLPKHPRLMKLFSEPSNKKLVQHTETEYLRDQSRRMHEIDDELFYAIDEKNHQINLTDKGRELLMPLVRDKDFFILPDLGTEFSMLEGDETLSRDERQSRKDELTRLYAERSERIHTVTQLLRAYSLYAKDDEYVVTDDGRVMIVDEFTGRLLPGRRYSDGLHQAIEAKEGVRVERDMQTLATITLQNYFRLYKKLAGMTGTAETEAAEFFDIYKLDVVVVPTNKPMVRDDMDDVIFKTKREKFNAVLEEIERMREESRPVLVGTTSVEVSETISRMLKRKNIPHNVLNAKQHQREAEIVSHAGLPGAITIATNMAGRGTDIKLLGFRVLQKICQIVREEQDRLRRDRVVDAVPSSRLSYGARADATMPMARRCYALRTGMGARCCTGRPTKRWSPRFSAPILNPIRSCRSISTTSNGSFATKCARASA